MLSTGTGAFGSLASHLPEGTSYNAYLVQGSQKTALLDTVDPAMSEVLLAQLEGVPQVDYVMVHHHEQDPSGTIPLVLERYPTARVLATPKGKGMLVDLLHLDPGRIDAVADGDSVSLGDRTLEFIQAPWVHWPETMLSYLIEEKTVFVKRQLDVDIGDN